MKLRIAVTVVAAATLGLQLFAAAKSSSSSNSQSLLDPLAIQEETAQNKSRAKHNKPPKQKRSHLASAAREKQQRSSSRLSNGYELPPAGALSAFQKSPAMIDKTTGKHSLKVQKKMAADQRKRSLAWNNKNDQSKSRKNIFASAADTTGRAITAPARGLKALFTPKKNSEPRGQ